MAASQKIEHFMKKNQKILIGEDFPDCHRNEAKMHRKQINLNFRFVKCDKPTVEPLLRPKSTEFLPWPDTLNCVPVTVT